METIQYIALSMGVAWASGINLYAAVFMLGYLGSTGNFDLPPEMMVVTDPLVMTAAGLMYCVEFFADKTPGVDTAWDTLHTFIRIPLGAVLAMSAVGDTTPAVELAAFLVGGSLTAATHATKAGSRVIINTSPEPVSNWLTSLGEDFLVITGIWTALTYPLVFVVFLILFIILMAWLLPKIWRGIKRIISTLRDFIKGNKKEALPALNSSIDTQNE
jgi:ABC-type multidrug transport system fused ATPase/permease subunit